MSKENKVIKIAILGTGFGAIHTALQLKKERKRLPNNIKLEVDIISRNDYFWLVTMAHEIATGNLMPHDVVQSIRSMPRSIYDNYIQGEITSVNTDTGEVNFELIDTVGQDLETSQSKTYDYIVSALGSKTFYFGVEGAAEHALALKTLEDVRAIKNRIMQSFEDAEFIDDVVELQRLLHFVIVGGGATGVEIAAELAEMINISMSERFPKVVKYARVTVVHGGKRVGIPGQEWMSGELENVLQNKHCVNLRCDSFVSKVSPDGVHIGDDFIPATTVIWSGGVMASAVEFISSQEVSRNKQGRIEVQSDLSLVDSPRVFIIGDQASVKDESGNDYPMRAQFAVRQGRFVAKTIVAELRGKPRTAFSYSDKGVIIGLGDNEALASVMGLKLKGWFAYLLYKLIYIPQLIGIRAKVRTASSWLLNIFSPRDLSEI